MGLIHLPHILEKIICQTSWVLNATITIFLMPNETSKHFGNPDPGKDFQ